MYIKMLDFLLYLVYNYKKEVIFMAQISLRIDDDIKRNAELACSEIGLSMSTAITIYLKKLAREKRIPFEVSVDPFYSDENMARLRKSIAQMEETGGTVHEANLD